jgi:hypothetical protein
MTLMEKKNLWLHSQEYTELYVTLKKKSPSHNGTSLCQH